MEEKLIYMKAYLERFNVIHVYVSNDYYQGICQDFYLKNITTNELLPARIVYSYEDKDNHAHVYQLLVNNIRLHQYYRVLNNYGLTCPLATRGIVNDPMFDHLYAYHDDDLGARYSTQKTTFKVWSPTSHNVCLEYERDSKWRIIPMKREDFGVYSITIIGDLEGVKYVYRVSNGDDCFKTTDPYAYASTANGQESVVVDPKKFIPTVKVEKKLKKKSDAVIYEMSVRDFTSSNSIDSKHKSQFLGVVERGLMTKNHIKAGFDYLLDLGITHVQLMPIFDFATVDELNPKLIYNWGYDPSQFNVPEGSYCSDLSDPYVRINECVQMINEFHKAGIRVTMDMVLNHVYDVNASSFERLVPHYYFRNDDYGNLSNGSYCSNDINSECAMVRKYILDMCRRWQVIYGVDGFRFDLMGILDVETMNQVEKQATSIDPNAIIYGEGWNMNTMLPDDKKAMIGNHASMPHISFFNDEFRDTLKGTTFSRSYQELGYLTGNGAFYTNAGKMIKNNSKFSSPVQSINYVECHDNATLYDYLKGIEDDESKILKRQKILNTAVILSQGIPLLHCGQEFCRTKKGISNSYNSSDEINQVDWDLKDIRQDQVDYVKNLLKLRANNEGFRYATGEEVENNVKINYAGRNILIYQVNQKEGDYKSIKVIYNPTEESTYYNLDDDEEIILSTESSEKLEYASLLIQPVSVYIIAKK